MIERKKKTCNICGKEEYIFSHGRCKSCAQKSYAPKDVKRVPISKMSPKRKTETVQYLKLRIEYINTHPECEVRLKGCSIWSTDIHHLYSGKDRQKHFTDFENVKATCRSCHEHIHNFPKESRENGLLK